MSGSIVETAFNLIRKKSVTSVSFALFGTVLLRRCYDVEGVYEHALELSSLPGRIKEVVDSFVQHRVLALNMLRMQTLSDGEERVCAQVSGISIEAIYDRFAFHSFNLPSSVRSDMVAAELAAECDLAYVNPNFLPFYNEATRIGLRVGIVAESYWSAKQIRQILDKVAPELAFDFIISSNAGETKDSGRLFETYLREEKLACFNAVHIGVDDGVASQPTYGVALGHLPLQDDLWKEIYKREEFSVRMLTVSDRGLKWRMDSGLNNLRHAALDMIGVTAAHHLVGANVFGPVMLGFQRFIETRLSELAETGREIRVIFLARDGYLPMRVWQMTSPVHADYAEINRRIALIAACEGKGGLEMIQSLISLMDTIGVQGVKDFFKVEITPKIRKFFDKYDGKAAPGAEFASAFPRLIGRKKLKEISDNLRNELLFYLDSKVGGLKDCTDLVLVDLGYTGNIQKGMRKVFDVSGHSIRLHGIYLLPHGESFGGLTEGDSVRGYFDETVVTPALKRAVMRDAPLIEEICCAPVGSARCYESGKEIREPEVRSKHDISLCLEVQDECIRYIEAFRKQSVCHNLDPLKNFDNYRAWSAAILSRFLMLPTMIECQTFGPMLHDVSLGSSGLIATITTEDVKNLMETLPFPAVCSIHHPPVWLGGSINSYNPMAGFGYAIAGYAMPVDDFFRDFDLEDCGAVIIKGEDKIPVPVNQYFTPLGEVRLRVPVLQKDSASVVAIHLRGAVTRGVIRSIVLQRGKNISDAALTRNGEKISFDKIEGLRLLLVGNFFQASGDDSYLLVKVPDFKDKVAIITLLILPVKAP